MNKTVNSLEEIGDDTLLDTTLMWVPQMGFSFGLDIICTSMIAGFLITHHRLIKRYNIRNTTTYLSFLVIIVESAALSSLAKGIQLLLGCLIGSKGSRLAITLNIFFIPLVVSTSNYWKILPINSLDHFVEPNHAEKSIGDQYCIVYASSKLERTGGQSKKLDWASRSRPAAWNGGFFDENTRRSCRGRLQ